MNKYILRSCFDCLVKVENEENLLDSNSQIVFDYPQKVLIYPLSYNKFSFPFTIDLTQSSDSEICKIFEYNGSKLFYLNSPYSITNEVVEEVSCQGKKCEISLAQGELSFKVDKLKKTLPILGSYKSYTVQTNNSFVILFFNGNEDSLYLFNVNDYSITHLEGQKIELIDNKIFVSKQANDIVSHQIYDTYEIKGDKLTKIAGKFKVDALSRPLKEGVLPLAFVEALKIGDYLLALDYLGKNLQDSTSTEHLKTYFGEIKSFVSLEPSLIAIINNKETKIYSFTVKDNKIEEIETLH